MDDENLVDAPVLDLLQQPLDLLRKVHMKMVFLLQGFQVLLLRQLQQQLHVLQKIEHFLKFQWLLIRVVLEVQFAFLHQLDMVF